MTFVLCLNWVLSDWSSEQLKAYTEQLHQRANHMADIQANPASVDRPTEQTLPIFSHQGTYYTAQSALQWPAQCPASRTAPPVGQVDLIECEDGNWLIGLRTLVSHPSIETKEIFLWSVLSPQLVYKQSKGTLLLACFSIFLGLSLLGGHLLSASVSDPLRQFNRALIRLKNGDYKFRLGAPPLEELQTLTDAFNEMGQAIEDRDRYFRETAFRDTLTGLDNKAFLTLIVDQRIQRAAEPLYFITWSVDNLSGVYEVLGQDTIDYVLKRVAKKARRLSPGHLALARLEGNLFAMVIPQGLIHQPHLPKLEKALRLSVQTGEFSLDIHGHAGLACFPEHGQHADTLLRRADLARQLACQRKQAWLPFEPQMERRSADRLALLAQMRRALERDEFELFLQPKLNLRENRVTHAEALIRWRHPERGLIQPGEFIPLAEQTGIIREITHWALSSTYALMQQFQHSDIGISVNLSAQDLEDDRLLGHARTLQRAHPELTARITLEITESNTINDPEQALSLLNRFAQLGHKISVDDFGSGYSSLAYLKRFPVSELKIDRSLVHRADQDTDASIIVQSTIDMGHTMGLTVTVEGVETEGEFALIDALGADFLQGYYLSPALPVDIFYSRFAFVDQAHWTQPI